MEMKPNISYFIGCDSSYKDSAAVLFGAPFDSTTSYRPGTRFGPSAMRSESFGIETYSPYLDKDLLDYSIFDAGDLELTFGNPAKALEQIEKCVSNILSDDKLPIMLGGEHLVTLGAVRAIHKRYTDVNIIHFDAHADLRLDYLEQELSHATVMRRIWDMLGDKRIHQFGIRSGEKTEFEFAKSHTCMHKFSFTGLAETVELLNNKPVYLSIDLDVLDSSVFPGTGTPEAGGVSFIELLEAIRQLHSLNIVGCDVNELCPVYDISGSSTALACKLLREVLLTILQQH